MNLLQKKTNTTTTKRDFVALPPAVGDRITFKTSDDGELAGFVSAFRPHLGNGELFAWVELDHQWPGMFRGVPLADIESADGFGRGLDLPRSIVTGNKLEFRKQYLCDFSTRAAVTAGRPCFGI
jgi:hypothetical protein